MEGDSLGKEREQGLPHAIVGGNAPPLWRERVEVGAWGWSLAPADATPTPADAEAPREALRFHATAMGAQVRLDVQRRTARRRATFHDGIVFSQRPVRRGERVALRVLCHEHGWFGGLRVGFTRLDPARLSAPSLPPFVCPDLEQQSPTWAAMLPNGCALAGDVVHFWVNCQGRLFAQVNAGPWLLLRKGVLMDAPLWAVMDVYGTTKAIELLDEAMGRDPGTNPGSGSAWRLRCCFSRIHSCWENRSFIHLKSVFQQPLSGY